MPATPTRSEPPRGVVIGAGQRGAGAYVPYLARHPDAARIVAVAEPDARRRERFARDHGLPEAACFGDFRGLLARPPDADFALVATPDALHVEPALGALEAGWHVLLEKPMALDEDDCRRLVAASERTGRLLQICHVLRYAPFFRALHDRIADGELGRVVSIQHSENVSFWHYAHSYCRGHWRNVAASSPMILAKSCHDLDLLTWLAGARPRRIASTARPTELHEGNAPEGAPDHCIEGCPHADTCPYDAVALYRDARPLLLDVQKTAGAFEPPPPHDAGDGLPWAGWPVDVMVAEPTRERVERALRESRFGRCVYRVGDNDQVSAQCVVVEFANGVQASFTMHGASHREGREIRVDGTRGSAWGGFYTLEQRLFVADHKSGRQREVPLEQAGLGHGGGDLRLFGDFLAAIRGESAPLTTARESLDSHLMAFAAHRAAGEHAVVELDPA